MVVIGLKWLYSGKKRGIPAKWLYSGKIFVFGKSGCIQEKVVVLGQKWL